MDVSALSAARRPRLRRACLLTRALAVRAPAVRARAARTFAALALAWLLGAGLAPAAFADVPPHVPTGLDTDVCAMCHRAHTSASSATWSTSAGETRTALLVGTGGNDIVLCFSCHGVDALGSAADAESAFVAASAHSLDPSASAYGPSPKTCSTCHDSHGSARTPSGTPYPALLRVWVSTETVVWSGDAVCTACHSVRPGNRFPGPAVWAQTAHSRMTTPATGTGIACSNCHEQHGSPVAPLIRSRIATPLVSMPATVTGNDRSLCLACHSGRLGVWTGEALYTGSSHASATATVTVSAEWAADGVSRLVGECQTCHAPMGAAPDASSAPYPDQLAARGRDVCDACHRAGGVARTDFAALRYSPQTPGPELLAAFDSAAHPSYGRVQIHAREATAAGPLIGPREIAAVTRVGALAAGDVDDDAPAEMLVADASAARLALIERDPLKGAKATLLTFPSGVGIATQLAVGDVFVDGSGRSEIVAASSAGVVTVMRLEGGSLSTVASATLGAAPSGLAVGDVAGGGSAEVVAVWPNALRILTASGATLVASSTSATRLEPVALAVGDLDAESAKLEIAVANAGETLDVVSLFDGDGAEYAAGGDDGDDLIGGPTAIAVGDALPGVDPASTSGAEIVLAYALAGGQSGVRVIRQPSGGGLGSHTDYATGARANAAAVAFGDADGDGTGDVAVALAGEFTRDASAMSPAIRVFSPVMPAGTSLTTTMTLKAGAVEMAGGRASVAIADLGAVGPSRHPVSVSASHVSTETTAAARAEPHVECHDCHSHAARPESADTTLLPGELMGARGVTLSGAMLATASAEYEVCLYCHSPQVASVIATNVAGGSCHPVAGALPGTATNTLGDTFEAGWAKGDRVRCSSCHGTAMPGAPDGPHRSTAFPLLQRRYLGTDRSDTALLCLKCHRADIYLTGTAEAAAGPRSGFYRDTGAPGDPTRKLHSWHTGSGGVLCGSCHVSHGTSSRPHLLRAEGFTWSATAQGGECVDVACHSSPSQNRPYDR